MKADIHQQWKLLDLQKLDTRLDQIAHRLKNLPQQAEVTKATAVADKAAEEAVLAQTAVMDVEREIKRSEGDVEQVEARMKRNQERLDSGTGSAKDLQAIQHELATLERRKGVLEDAELEIMERAEELRGRQATFDKLLADAEGKVKELKAAMAAEAAELETERVSVQHQRGDMTGAFDADLLAEYDRIRAMSGVAAAALRGKRCLGCGLELNQRDLERIRNTPMDTLVHCDECGRILVRMPNVEA